jgi:hypothetical protein
MTGQSGRIGQSLVAALATLILAGGCGSSGSSSETKAQKQAQAQEQAAKARASAEAKRKAKASAVYKECKAVVGPLDDQLTALNSRLSIGLPFADYGQAVGAAKVAYDKLIRDAKARGGISNECINRVGKPLQSGLNAYVKAYNVWNSCIDTYSCSFSKGSPALKKAQAQWAIASRVVNRADGALTGLQPGP